jgi:hypothetical protein
MNVAILAVRMETGTTAAAAATTVVPDWQFAHWRSRARAVKESTKRVTCKNPSD